jgi:hypothetical protein
MDTNDLRELMIDKAEDLAAIIDAAVMYRTEEGRDDQAHGARLGRARVKLEDAIKRYNETSARVTKERSKALDTAGAHRRWTAPEIDVVNVTVQRSPLPDRVRLRVLDRPGRATYLDLAPALLERFRAVLSKPDAR